MDFPSRPGAAPRLALIFLVSAALSSCSGWGQGREGRHIFLFIGDGMGLSCEVAASRYRYGVDDGLAWRSFPFEAWAATWDVTSYEARASAAGKPPYDEAAADPLVGYDPARGGAEPWPAATAPAEAEAYLLAAATDSAAAATAMATGRKTDAGNIAWARGDPANGALPTLAELMESRLGAGIGIVTTVPFDHATPAAFAAHEVGRGDYASIAGQMAGATWIKAIVGGGHPGYCAAYFDAGGLDSLRRSAYWRLAERRDGRDGQASLAAAAALLGRREGLFGLFGGADGSFETPVPADSPGFPSFAANGANPSLAAAAVAVAERLAEQGRDSLLVAEQGDIDWANHANDYPRMVGAICSLDDAVRAIETYIDRPGDSVTWDNSLLVVVADHSTGFLRFDPALAMGKGDLPANASLGAWSFPGGNAAYVSTGHANELVTLAARGAGSEAAFGPYVGLGRPGTRIVENTDIFQALADFAGAR